MSKALHSETQSGDDPIILAQAKTDTLLDKVNEQITLDTFNPNDQQLLKQLVECLGDTRGMTRLRAAETLGEIGEPTTPFLVEALAHHTNVVVRRAAAKTLTLIADPIAIDDLVHALLTDEDTVVTGSAAGALARIGEAAVPELLKILESPEHPESIKGHVAWALAFIGSEAEEYLYKALSSDSNEVRAAVIGALTKVAQEKPEGRALTILINALNDSAEIVRCEAAAVLGNLAHQKAVPHLVDLLHHESWESRKSAALALMKIGDRTALKPLQSALASESVEQAQRIIKLAISQLKRQLNE
ncbi:MAG: HEAT repeat domain-containing protein [Coleofasciculaceae cyanobacterium]